MRKSITAVALLLGVMITFTACETDNTSLLSDGVWKFENMTTDSENETIRGFILLGKAVLTDGTLEFNSDKTYILNAPLADEPQTGTWSLVGDDQLIMNGDDGNISTSNIQTLTKKELKYLETFVDENMDSYSVTTTWVKD